MASLSGEGHNIVNAICRFCTQALSRGSLNWGQLWRYAEQAEMFSFRTIHPSAR